MSYEEGLQSITLVADSTLATPTGVSNIGPGSFLYPTLSVAITNGFQKSSTTITLTTAVAHGAAVGDTIVVAGATTIGNNGSFVVASVPSTTTLTYTNSNGAAENGLATTTARRIPSTAALQYRFVKPGSASNSVTLASGAVGEQVIGVMQSRPQTVGQAATIGLRGVTNMVAGGAITAGQRVVSDSVGRAIAASAAVTLDANDAFAVYLASSGIAKLTLQNANAKTVLYANLQPGDSITIAGATTAGNNGTFPVLAVDTTNRVVIYYNPAVVGENGAASGCSATVVPNRAFNAVALASATTVGELIPVLLKA